MTDLHPSFWQLTGAPPPTFKMPTSDRAAEDARRAGRYTGRRWREDWDEVQDRLCALFEKHQFYRLVEGNFALIDLEINDVPTVCKLQIVMIQ